jgi:hypothetical protein
MHLNRCVGCDLTIPAEPWTADAPGRDRRPTKSQRAQTSHDKQAAYPPPGRRYWTKKPIT